MTVQQPFLHGLVLYTSVASCVSHHGINGNTYHVSRTSDCLAVPWPRELVAVISHTQVLNQCQITACGICVGESGTVTLLFLQVFQFGPVSIIAPLLHSHLSTTRTW